MDRFLGPGGACGGSGPFTDNGHNLDSDSSCGLTAATSLSGVDPLLGTLGDNGGPTKTMRPLTGSPAINAGGGACSGTDQRGITRPQGRACDIGSVEVRVRADAKVALPGSSFKGDNIYNSTGYLQTVTRRIEADQVRSELIQVQNDGEVADSFTIKGPGDQAPLSVTYTYGGVDVTTQVEAGTFTTPTLAPGDSYTITLTWTADPSIPTTSALVWKVRATSTDDTSIRDVVRAQARSIAS